MDSTENDIPLTERKVVRRGLIAGLAAFSAAAALKVTGKDKAAEAAHNGPMLIGAVNTEDMGFRTFLVADPPIVGNPALVVFQGSGPPFSNGQADAIQGMTRSNVGFAAGVQGRNLAPNGQSVGVFGLSTSSEGTGVYGTSALGGTMPTAATGVGVYGNGGVAGVRGSSPNGRGVIGTSSPNIGVLGISDTADGVYGLSVNGRGVVGASAAFVGVFGVSDSSTGVYGLSVTPNVAAIVGQSLAAGAGKFAAYFDGRVLVDGNFQVTGVKNAVVPMADGSHASVYCQEATEPYFEDFGRANLQGGVARVQLDADFLSIVKREDYMVFLTPSGDSNGLYIANQDALGFEVRETTGGKSNLAFSYRIVAKRRDVEAQRLARVDLAKLRTPDETKRRASAKETVKDEMRNATQAAQGMAGEPPKIPAQGPSVPPSTAGNGPR